MKDVQKEKDTRNIYLHQVGIRGLKYPVVIKNHQGEMMPAAGKVDLRESELQTSIQIPREAYEGYHGRYIKYAMRNAMDIATMGCSVNVKLSEDRQTLSDIRIAYGVAGPVPMRAEGAEALARGQKVTPALAKEFAQQALADIHPRNSWRASLEFREHIATVLAERAFWSAVHRAGGEVPADAVLDCHILTGRPEE